MTNIENSIVNLSVPDEHSPVDRTKAWTASEQQNDVQQRVLTVPLRGEWPTWIDMKSLQAE